jgi:hypothetical protein
MNENWNMRPVEGAENALRQLGVLGVRRRVTRGERRRSQMLRQIFPMESLRRDRIQDLLYAPVRIRAALRHRAALMNSLSSPLELVLQVPVARGLPSHVEKDSDLYSRINGH